jgi:hypothetical protein
MSQLPGEMRADRRSEVIGHLHTHPDHAARYRAGHDFVLVSTAAIWREHQQLHGALYVVTFDPRPVTGPGAIAGLRLMSLDEAHGLFTEAGRIPKHGRIVNAVTLEEVPALDLSQANG